MKHKVLSILLLLAALFFTNTAHATVFTWSMHNLTFEVPDGGQVTYNSATHFEIMWHDMAVIIDLYNKNGVNDKTAKNELLRRANGFNMFDTNIDNLRVKGFKCRTLDGTMPDGSRALLANLECKNKDLFITVTVNYLLGNIEYAEDIIKSFSIGKQKAKEEKKQKVQTEENAKAQEEKLRKEQELMREENKKAEKKNKKVYKTYDI